MKLDNRFVCFDDQVGFIFFGACQKQCIGSVCRIKIIQRGTQIILQCVRDNMIEVIRKTDLLRIFTGITGIVICYNVETVII